MLFGNEPGHAHENELQPLDAQLVPLATKANRSHPRAPPAPCVVADPPAPPVDDRPPAPCVVADPPAPVAPFDVESSDPQAAATAYATAAPITHAPPRRLEPRAYILALAR